MALSNWDTLAWDAKGEPCLGTLECPDGVQVEIYKNWAYVRDRQAHRGHKEPFIAPTIMELWSGELQYRWLSLLCNRGRQNSIFLVATFEQGSITKALFGIGAYGYKGNRYVGVEPKTVESYLRWLRRAKERSCLWRLPDKLPTFAPPIRLNQGDTVMAPALGVSLPTSDPGQAEEPILSTLVRSVKTKGVKAPAWKGE